MAIAIAGCGGGGAGSNSTGATNPASVTKFAAATWQALKPQIDPASISVSMAADSTGAVKPVVTFKVTDDLGNPVIGLGGQIAATSAALPTNYNLQFTLAKLIPANATTGDPSKWVSYLVTAPVVTNGTVTGWTGTYPTSDTNGTLVDNNDGTYKYTFLRDIAAVQSQVNALVDTTASSASAVIAANCKVGGKSVCTKSDLDPANLAYDATATTRLGIIITGSQPGTGTNTPDKIQVANPVPLLSTFNVGYDFVPNGGAVTATRDIVVKASCASCHDNRAIGHISTNSATNGIPTGNFVGRNDPRLCVTCHTDQTKYSFTNLAAADANGNYTGAYYRTVDGQAAFTYPRMVHQFHMGGKLTNTGYNLNGHCNDPADTSGLYNSTKATANSAACFNTVGLPQAVTNCSVCHDGNATKSDGTTNANKTKDGNNWMANPSIIACGSCHDGINFATGTGVTAAETRIYQAAVAKYNAYLTALDTATANGTTPPTAVALPAPPVGLGHAAGATGKTNDTCATCHATSGNLTSGFPATNKVTEVALAHRNTFGTLNNPTPPDGIAKIAYDISSVTLNTAGNPVIKFRIKKTISGVTANVATLANSTTPLSGFTAGPSLYVAFAIPQDGIAAPADFNVYLSAPLATIASNPVGSTTLSSLSSLTADANGYFTATLYGTATQPIVVPANATLVTGAMIGGFTQAGTFATMNTGSIVNPAILSRLAMKALDGSTGRRAVVQTAKCDSCHAQLGTDPNFHGGARNDPQACNICHNGNRTSNGWAADSKYYIHGIHGATKRTVPFTWAAADVDDNYSDLGYPGLLKDCNQCHLPATVNFSSTSAAVPNMLWSTVATGKFVNVAGSSSNLNITKYSYSSSGGTLPDGTTTTSAACVKTAGTTTTANPSIQTALGAIGPSPYVVSGINTASAPDYGVGFTTNFNTTVTNACTAGGVAYAVPALGGVRQADLSTLVNSPIASACSSCHDTSAATLHMKQNGGTLYATRASVGGATLVNTETCLTCHGAGKLADAAVVHGAK